jgi:hypothetical protein
VADDPQGPARQLTDRKVEQADGRIDNYKTVGRPAGNK